MNKMNKLIHHKQCTHHMTPFIIKYIYTDQACCTFKQGVWLMWGVLKKSVLKAASSPVAYRQGVVTLTKQIKGECITLEET